MDWMDCFEASNQYHPPHIWMESIEKQPGVNVRMPKSRAYGSQMNHLRGHVLPEIWYGQVSRWTAWRTPDLLDLDHDLPFTWSLRPQPTRSTDLESEVHEAPSRSGSSRALHTSLLSASSTSTNPSRSGSGRQRSVRSSSLRSRS